MFCMLRFNIKSWIHVGIIKYRGWGMPVVCDCVEFFYPRLSSCTLLEAVFIDVVMELATFTPSTFMGGYRVSRGLPHSYGENVGFRLTKLHVMNGCLLVTCCEFWLLCYQLIH